MACELALEAVNGVGGGDWWWNLSLARCYHRLAMFHQAETYLRSSLKLQPTVLACLMLGRVYMRRNQPVSALDIYQSGLQQFPAHVSLINAAARVYEARGDLSRATRHYRLVAQSDATSLEAMACIGLHHFYNDQPEIALTFYMRLLQMGVCSAELFNNVALCCFHAQQYHMAMTCFERALVLADDTVASDVWYNLGHVALSMGDMKLAHQCLSLSVQHNTHNAAAHNNLGVLAVRQDRRHDAVTCFSTAAACSQQQLLEPLYNWASQAEQMGDLQTSYVMVQQSLSVHPDHADSHALLDKLRQTFTAL